LNREIRDRLTVFRAGGRDYTIGEVLRFGLNQPPPDTDTTGIAEKVADLSLDQAVEQFRYRYDLISGAECEAWLAARGLSFAQLRGSLSRKLKAAAADAQQQQIDTILDDSFARHARHLSWRVALACASPPVGAFSDALLADWEQAFAAARAEVLSSHARQRFLELARRPLTQIEYEIAEFDDLEAAREARCCVLEDGQTLATVAHTHGYAHRAQHAFIDELPAAWSAALNATAASAVAEPIVEGSRILLLSPRRYLPPSLDLPEISRRIDQQLIEQHFNLLAAEHVRWQLRFDEG